MLNTVEEGMLCIKLCAFIEYDFISCSGLCVFFLNRSLSGLNTHTRLTNSQLEFLFCFCYYLDEENVMKSN
jgi:hypothetical protein